jgi:CRISPR-associated protein Cmr1
MGEVRKLKVTLETVTPLFLGGAEPRGKPELRAPSFRGAMRYWWRALAGGVVGEEVTHWEPLVFGSTERGSTIVVRVYGKPATQPFQSYRPPGLRPRESSGHDYMYWSMRGFRGEKDRIGIRPGERFELEVGIRPGTPDARAGLWQSGAALWLLLHLGGLGSRSRRTAGSLVARSEPEQLGEWPLPPFQIHACSGNELVEVLKQGLCLLRRGIARDLSAVRSGHTTQFDVLHPEHCRIWVVSGKRPWRRWIDAVEGIGRAMRDFRNRHPPDYQNVRDWLLGGTTPATVERAAFGLPLPFRYNSPPRVSGVVQGARHERRASPLHLRITPLADGDSLVGVAVLFTSSFLPPGERLKARSRRSRGTAEAPNLDLLEEFVTTSFAHCWEVSYA